MATRTKTSLTLACALTAFTSSGSRAAINDMHMFSSGGGGQGSAAPCLENTEIVRLAKALRDIDGRLQKLSGSLGATDVIRSKATVDEHGEAALCISLASTVDDLAVRVRRYRGLLPEDAIARPALSHRIVYSDRIARELQRGSGSGSLVAQWRQMADSVGVLNQCYPQVDLSVFRDGELQSALSLLAGIPIGTSITLPYEPYLPAAGTTVLALNFNYWPFDEHDGMPLAAEADLRSARVDVNLAHSVTDWLRLGVRAPFTLIADTPHGTAPERTTGIGDLNLMAQAWWTEPLLHDSRVPLDSIFSVLHLGSAVRLVVPVGSEEGDRSHGNTVAHLDFLKAALQLRPRGLPRFHLQAGRIVELEDDGDDRHDSPSRYPGGWDFATGVIWNLDPWRGSGSREWNLAWWGDLAGMFHDRAAGGSKRALELRGGVGYLRQSGGRGATDRAVRTLLSLELARRLDDEGLRSGTSWQVAVSVSH